LRHPGAPEVKNGLGPLVCSARGFLVAQLDLVTQLPAAVVDLVESYTHASLAAVFGEFAESECAPYACVHAARGWCQLGSGRVTCFGGAATAAVLTKGIVTATTATATVDDDDDDDDADSPSGRKRVRMSAQK
jgi:hypothetical protein